MHFAGVVGFALAVAILVGTLEGSIFLESLRFNIFPICICAGDIAPSALASWRVGSLLGSNRKIWILWTGNRRG